MSENNTRQGYPLRRELVFTYLDIRYNPNYPFDKSILPGTPTKPTDTLTGFVKTDEFLWYFDSEKDLPQFLATDWETLSPIFVEWYNDRFSEKHGRIKEIFAI